LLDIEIDDLIARIQEVDHRIADEKFKLNNNLKDNSDDVKFQEMNQKMDHEIERYKSGCSELLKKWAEMVKPLSNSIPIKTLNPVIFE